MEKLDHAFFFTEMVLIQSGQVVKKQTKKKRKLTLLRFATSPEKTGKALNQSPRIFLSIFIIQYA